MIVVIILFFFTILYHNTSFAVLGPTIIPGHETPPNQVEVNGA
jgi:hypothetical protein